MPLWNLFQSEDKEHEAAATCEILVDGVPPIVADIVFVHGLRGHRRKTWTKKNVCWPKELLPEEESLSHVRILSFGYDAAIFRFVRMISQNSLFEHSQSLLMELAKQREGHLETRPIVFVAHSVGGLLIKDALYLSYQQRNTDSDSAPTFKATKGIVFFGTPHRGSDKVVWGRIVTAIAGIGFANTNGSILRDLEQNSGTLERIEANFSRILEERPLSIHTFMEELPMSRLFGKVVKNYSAKIGSYYHEEHQTIYANHVEMVKFCSREDSEYKKAVFAIERVLKGVTKCEVASFKEDISEFDAQKTPTGTFDNTPSRTAAHFVPRKALLDDLKASFERTSGTSPSLVVVLHGMGGTGKTQLALEYCRSVKRLKQVRALIWIDASSRKAAQNSMNIFAKWLSPNRKLDNAEVIALVKGRLSDWNDEWLMVFDNLDNPSDLSEISSFFPNGRSGSILVTTRFTGANELGHAIQVDCMGEEDGLQLLLGTYAADGEELTAARQILNLLGRLPLAIDQARAYISKRRLGLRDFVKEYEKRKQTIMKETPRLWHYERSIPGEDNGRPLNVFTTWEMSLSLLGSEPFDRDTAKLRDVLAVFAFFHPFSISEQLFVRSYEGWASPMSIFYEDGKWDHFKYETIVAEMREMSLLQFSRRDGSEIVISIHPLVSEWLRMTLDARSKRIFLGCAILHLHQHSLDMNDFKRREEALSHLRAINHAEEFPINNDLFYNAYITFGTIYRDFRMYNEAEHMVHVVLEGYGETHPNHQLTLLALHALGILYRDQRRLADAEKLFGRALAGYEEVLDSTHTQTLGIVFALANLYLEQDHLTEAEDTFYRARAGYEKAYGPDHEQTRATCHAIGNVYQRQGRLAEAEKMFQQVMAGNSPDSSSMLQTLHNLGNLYVTQGRLTDAEDMLNKALNGYEKEWGPDHPLTLDIFKELGSVYGHQGRLAEAENMYHKVLVGCQKARGPGDEKTLDAVHNLGSLYACEGRLQEAEGMFDKELAGYEKLWGVDHPTTLAAVHNLGSFYEYQGRLTEAEKMFNRALGGYEKGLGHDHIKTLDTVHCLRKLYTYQSRPADLRRMFDWELAGREKTLGPYHKLTLDTAYNLGIFYKDQGHLKEAGKSFEQALAGYEKMWSLDHTPILDTVWGFDHVPMLDTIYALGDLYVIQDLLAEAEKMLDRALVGYETALGPDHASTLNTVRSLGEVYNEQDRLDDSEKMFYRALAGYEKVFGPDHVSTLNSVHSLGEVYAEQDQLTEAKKLFIRALNGFEKIFGPDGVSTLGAVHSLGLIYQKQGYLGKAEKMFDRVLVGYEKVLGLDHMETLGTVHGLGNLYSDQERLEGAEAMFHRALTGFEKTLGPDHMWTLNVVHDLGVFYRDIDRLTEAENLLSRAVAGFEKARGRDHRATLDAYNNLGIVYTNQERLEEARDMYLLAGTCGDSDVEQYNASSSLGWETNSSL